MTEDRTRRARELFDLALERESHERAAFLAAECGGDESLRHEVASLLEFHDRAEGFLDRPALDVAAREAARDQAPFAAGRRFRNYELVERIGAGGMGEVYLAVDETLNRKVALKFLPPSLTGDAERLARFRHEAIATSALNHPCIVTVHEIGSADGIHFIATELVDGETLRERLARGPLPIAEVLDVAVQTAEALAAAHDAGIVHRDVKPENVMVRRDGYVKVLDFGLAKRVDPRPGGPTLVPGAGTLATEPGRLMGTAAYMSPEQLHGLDVDARTDIWSLGVVLYELITGSRPFAAESRAGTVAAILEREPAPIAPSSGNLPAALAAIVRRALAKDRDERYPSARALLADLETVRSDLAFEARTPRRAWRVAAATAALAVVAVVAALGIGRLVSPPAAAPSAAAPVRSIAVLPFLPIAADGRDEAFELGMADTIITKLGGLGRLEVRPTGAVRAYTGLDRDAGEIGRRLKVEAVLDGTIQRSGDRLRVNLRLVRVGDGAVVWTAALDERAADIFDLQDAISERVVVALQLELSGDDRKRLARRDTESSEAYDLYVKGRYFLDRRGEEWRRKSIEHFSKAVEADPTYAPAYAGLADAYYEMVYWGHQPSREYMPRARAAAERALAIDDSLAEAHASLAIVLEDYEWRFDDAEREYRRAIALDRTCVLAHQRLGQLLAEQGRFDEARAEHAAALEIDPLSLNANMSLAALHFFARDYPAAIDQLRRTLELDPEYGEARGLLGWACVQAGAHDDAIRAWIGDSQSAGARALREAYAKGGIRAYFARDVELARRDDRPLHVFVAMELAYLGRNDEAFAVLDRAYAERDGWLGELATDPSWDPLRSDPRFADLLRRVGVLRWAAGSASAI